CGYVMKLQIRATSKDTISAARFKTFGCGVAIASSSWMTERIIGLSLSQAEQIKSTDIARELSLPVFKLYCSTFLEDAIRAAAKDYRRKQPHSRLSNMPLRFI
ncbi:nifU-like protein, partial [Mycena olivaceomarginata]